MSRERWFLTVGVASSVVSDILLAILAARPTGLYLLPWILIGTVMIAVEIGFELIEERMAAKSGRPSVPVRHTQDGGEIIRGRRQGADVDPSDVGFSLLVYVFLFALFCAVFGVLALFGRIGAHGIKAIILGLPFAFIGWTILVLFYRFVYGIRVYLAFSTDGVTFKGGRGGRTLRERFTVRWHDVADFTIEEGVNTGGPWLVAIPRPGSPLVFRGPTSRFYDAEKNLILICSLDDVGIQKHIVSGALDHWRPLKASNLP